MYRPIQRLELKALNLSLWVGQLIIKEGMVLTMKRTLSMILALLLIACSLPAIITSYAENSNNLAADYTNANGHITWSDNAGVYKSSIDGTANSVYGGHSWRFR